MTRAGSGADGAIPDAGTVVDLAADCAASTEHHRGDAAALNVHVPPVEGGIEAADGDRGRLAAAIEALEGRSAGCLHFPDPEHAAAGPWVLVEPLGGRLSTVHAGAGTVTVEFAPRPGGADRQLRVWQDRLDAVLEAARPRHDHYPVRSDDRGAFTTGMTTFALAGVDADDGVVTFEVKTTPATTASRIADRFGDLPGVESVGFEPGVGVAVGSPPEGLRRAAEAACEAAVGDWEYEWFPRPTAFSRVPCGAKLAVGTGSPGGGFDADAYGSCRTILDGVLGRWRERAEVSG